MAALSKRRILILVSFWLFVLVIVTAGFYFIESLRFSDMTALVNKRENVLREYATLLRENAATVEVSNIARDCASEQRAEYDNLLGNLGSLTRPQLVSLNQVFSECAYFYPDQQAMMVLLFSREFEAFDEMLSTIEQASTLTDTRTNERLLWRKLVELETVRSELGLELVQVQKRIVSALLAGTPVNDASYEAERVRANEVLELTLTTKNEIERVYTELLD